MPDGVVRWAVAMVPAWAIEQGLVVVLRPCPAHVVAHSHAEVVEVVCRPSLGGGDDLGLVAVIHRLALAGCVGVTPAWLSSFLVLIPVPDL